MKMHDLTGRKFGKVLVLRFSHTDGKNRYWIGICDCGKEAISTTNRYLSGKKNSCGCLNGKNGTHHMAGTPEYVCWATMKRRCYDPKHIGYKNYGAKGIRVCARWLTSFENFFEDMGKKPTPKHSIDRIDSNGDYEPSNCRWVDWMTQSTNKERTHKIMYKGALHTITEIAALSGLKRGTVMYRFVNHKSFDDPLLVMTKRK